MRSAYRMLVFALFAPHFHAQTSSNDAALLAQLWAKYDAPFSRDLKSFECAVSFDWKQHWAETYRVGDEGTDEEIEKTTQPIPNRVTVTRDDAVVTSGITLEQEQQLPHGGMAEGLLKHAVRFSLRTWLGASNNAALPQPGAPVHFIASPSGYTLEQKIDQFNVDMLLTPDMGLQSMAVKGSPSDRQEFDFRKGPQGFVLHTWTMGEDGDFRPGNHLIFTYEYQMVGGFQVPSQAVVNRESHHELWRYTLTDCSVTKNG